MDQPMERPTDGQTNPRIEMQGRTMHNNNMKMIRIWFEISNIWLQLTPALTFFKKPDEIVCWNKILL